MLRSSKMSCLVKPKNTLGGDVMHDVGGTVCGHSIPKYAVVKLRPPIAFTEGIPHVVGLIEVPGDVAEHIPWRSLR